MIVDICEIHGHDIFSEMREFWIVHPRLKNRIRDALMLSIEPFLHNKSKKQYHADAILIPVKQEDDWMRIPTGAADRQR